MSKVISNFTGTNFAGYDVKRHGYLKLAVLAHIIQNRDGGVGRTISNVMSNSPRTQMKRFRSWSENRDKLPHLGQVYEAIDRAPYIIPLSGGGTVVALPNKGSANFPFAYPIKIGAELEWLWMDQWYRPRMSFNWNASNNQTNHATWRQQRGLGTLLAYRGPFNWTYWARAYWNTRAVKLSDREKPWSATFDKTTGIINIVSAGNWNWSFNPGVDHTAEYLYLHYDLQQFTYRIGSGDTILEQIVAALPADTDTGYFPYIPVIVNSIPVSKVGPELGVQAEKAFKKVSGSKLSKLLEEIKKNPKAGDIDLATAFLGVQATTKKSFCKEYIYRYCVGLRQRAGNPTGAFSVTVGNDTIYPGSWASNAGYGITFKHMLETTGTGLRIPSAEIGSLVWEVVGESCNLHWQVSATEWRTMSLGTAIGSLTGLPGDGGTVALWQVINNQDDVGFIFPLHEPTLEEMSRLDAIEVCQEAMNLLVGSYTLINTSSLLGGILFFIAGVLMVAFPPGAAGIGLLGTNAAVGAAVGFTGTAAIIAGAVINAVAAIILMKVITRASVFVFGDKIGAIIGAVVGFAAVTVGTGLMNGQNLSSIWSSLGSASNIMALTNSVGSGISGYISAAIQDIQSDMQSQSEFYDTKMREIQKNYAEEFGYGNRILDPMSLTGATSGNYMENSSEFLTRTLLTGSDIADISLGMIGSFTDLTLSSALPGSE